MDTRTVVQQYIDDINDVDDVTPVQLRNKMKSLLEYITESDHNFDEEELFLIYLAAVKKYGMALEFIQPKASEAKISEDKYDQVCLEAVKQNANALKEIRKENRRLFILKQLGNEFVLSAVQKRGELLRYIPKQHRNFEILLAAVKKNADALMHVGEDAKEAQKESGVTEDEYEQLCIAAGKTDGYAIRHTKDEKIREKFFNLLSQEDALHLVKMEPSFLSYIPIKYLNFDLLLNRIKDKPADFQYLGKNPQALGISEDQYLQLCMEAVKDETNLFMLKFMDDEYKEYIINKRGFELTQEKIQDMLINNYAYVDCFPERLLHFLPQFLSTIEHIVVTKSRNLDNELSNAFMIYANSPDRKDKTLHVDRDTLDRLLSDLTKFAKPKSLNFVPMDHITRQDTTLANMEAKYIAEILAKHKNINRVTLHGCHTAKVKPLRKEKEMAKKYKDSLMSHSGFIVMNTQPDQAEIKKIFNKKAVDKNKVKTSTFFILIIENDTASILKLQRNQSGEIKQSKFNPSPESLKKIENLITGKKGFPKLTPTHPIVYLRAGSGYEFLSPTLTTNLMVMLSHPSHDRLSKDHPLYKSDKALFPFLTSANLSKDEEHKLETSILKSIKNAIESNPDIQQDVVVKGYTKAIHGDTKEVQFKGIDKHIYAKGYKPDEYGGRGSFFGKDKIDRKVHNEERRKQMQEMESRGKPSKHSDFKSVKVTIPGKKS